MSARRYELDPAKRTAMLGGLQTAYAAAKAAAASPVAATATPGENSAALRQFLARLPGLSDSALATMQALLDDDWTNPTITEAAFVDASLGSYFDTAAIKAALAARAAAAPPKDAAQNAVLVTIGDAVSAYLYRGEPLHERPYLMSRQATQNVLSWAQITWFVCVVTALLLVLR